MVFFIKYNQNITSFSYKKIICKIIMQIVRFLENYNQYKTGNITFEFIIQKFMFHHKIYVIVMSNIFLISSVD